MVVGNGYGHSRSNTSTVDIPTADGRADAFVAFPDDGKQYPGVLLYMDAIGLRPVLTDMVERLAEKGYYVLAPNVFYRHGRAPVIDIPDLNRPQTRDAFFERVMPIVIEHSIDRIHSDANAFIDFLTTRPDVRPGPVGVVGYCLGAVLAVRTAAAHPRIVKAAAGFHPGDLVTDEPDSPHRLAPHIDAELVFGFSENDMTPEEITQFTSSLDSEGIRHRSDVYPDTVHGFTMADTEAFSPEGYQ